jgi:hypothetical protein
MTYPEFWHRYLRAHAGAATRAVHYVGTSMALLCLLAFALSGDWPFLVAAPLIGYGFAWTSHALIEKNRPETFGHPFWALASDVRMLALAATGRLAPHLAAAGTGAPPSHGTQAL